MTLILILGFLLIIIFLWNPILGIFLFLITRTLSDRLADSFSLVINENISINITGLLGITFLFLGAFYVISKKINILSIPLIWPIILFLGIAAASMIFSVDIQASFYELTRLLTIFIFYILAYDIFTKDLKIKKNKAQSKFARQFPKIILISAIIPFLIASYQLITKTGLGGTTGIESRIYGTFIHPNNFALFALIIFAVTIFYVLKQKQEPAKNPNKFPIYLISAFSFLMLLATLCRGAILAALCFAFIIGILKSPKIIILTATAMLILFFASENVHDRIEDIYNPPAISTIRWRFKQWQRGWESFSRRPWLGYGVGTEQKAFKINHGLFEGSYHTHNDYLRSAIELGIIGFSAYSFLLCWALVKLLQAYKRIKLPVNKLMALTVLALFLSVILFSASDNVLKGTAAMWILWALVALVLAQAKKQAANLQRKRTGPGPIN
ncbi:MAG: O-antigen ligase family protein [Patescibacteria group bacterium]|nr:O-antigen ligase family protein [Patescibacteria group bacterium]